MAQNRNWQLAVNMISQVGVLIITMGINLFLTPFIVRSLGIDAYGFVGLSTNIIGYMQVASVALNSMAGRFIAIAYHNGDMAKANKYFSSVLYSNLILGILILLLSIGLLVYLDHIIAIPNHLITDVKLLFGILSINSVINLIFNVYMVSPFIKNRLDISSIQGFISGLIRVLILVILFSYFTSHLWYLGCSAITCSIYLIYINIRIKNKLTPELVLSSKKIDIASIKELLASGSWNLISKLGDIMQRGFDLLFANWFISATAMGILSITTNLPFIILQVFSMLSSSFAPAMTEDFAKGDIQTIKKEINKSVRLLSILSIIPISILYIYGDVFYSLWMPMENAKLLQQLTICGTFALIVTLPLEGFWNVFTITNKIKGSSLFMLANSILVFITVVLLLFSTDDNTTKMFIIAGVRSCWGVLRGLLFLPIYGAYCLNEKWTTFYKDLRKPLIGLILTLALTSLIRLVILPNSWVGFFSTSLLVAVISCSIGSILILSKSDLNIIYSKVKLIYTKYQR